MNRGTAIWGGDVVRALARLGIRDAAGRTDVAGLLGWGLETQAAPVVPDQEVPPVVPTPIRSGVPRPVAAASPPSEPGSVSSALGEARLVPLPPDPLAQPPGWLESAEAMETVSVPFVPSAPEPILAPAAQRGLAVALGAGLAESEELDVERAIERLSRCEPLRELPRQREWTLRHGVRVLVDEGPGMAPYRADIAQVVFAFAGAVGAADGLGGALSAERFVGLPVEELAGARRAPREAVRVLLTDLGIGRSREAASEQAWLDWAREARARGWRVVTLVPYRPARWPAALVKPLRCVHWDPSSTASRVVARVRG